MSSERARGPLRRGVSGPLDVALAQILVEAGFQSVCAPPAEPLASPHGGPRFSQVIDCSSHHDLCATQARESTLEMLSDVVERYARQLSRTAAEYANHCLRIASIISPLIQIIIHSHMINPRTCRRPHRCQRR